ncbi:P-loop containing nucleoside triphosphate hydrolase protein [Stachybotrys elegans]|uniref:P-loop containing nucleoside triphosphate hydrolase protein n=1 Tax=Stachybotrys elegans TaxID=80388 RepID=A0A8K0SWE1_9HYPO|nr:P-loop containing nucleoside triphosphate hydrolase protein [Stachybotrys elegans]
MAYHEERPRIVYRHRDDDDALSTSSYDSTISHDREPEHIVLDADELHPRDVVYVLRLTTRRHKTLATYESTNPFTSIPDYDNPSSGHSNHNDDENTDRPIIEIQTTVNVNRSLGNRRRNPPHSRRPPNGGSVPITMQMQFEEVDWQEPRRYDIEVDDYNAVDEAHNAVMKLRSPYLSNALKAVVSYYPFCSLDGKTLTFDAPYTVLYHHREALLHYRDNQPSCHDEEYAATTARHIDILLQFLKDNPVGKAVAMEEGRHKLPTPLATFDYYWLLLKPGSVVYAKMNDVWSAFVVSSFDRYPATRSAPYRINCWYIESDGTKTCRFMTEFTIPPWLGEQAIGSQTLVPEEYWVEDLQAQGGRTMREKQIHEGKMYCELLKRPTYLEHTGNLIDTGSSILAAPGSTGFMSGRVICDASGFRKYYDNGAYPPPYRGNRRCPPVALMPTKDALPLFLPRCGCTVCEAKLERPGDSPYVGIEDVDPLDTTQQSDLYYMVCKKVIPAFLLSTRRWGQVQLQNLEPVQSDKNAFKNLVLDDNIKVTVKALIGKFATATEGQVSPWGNDFVKNKGEGRIFLLHGTPGVGKTCTAECVAELTGRPLISLTSGDLGTDIYNVESELNYFLQLGQRYGALVLLDEADVYLERRRAKDISRNGLVSIFLRALEYYRGVLFLTTNRVQSFDRAFLSRIHVALHYRSLRDEDRERIWLNNFERLARDSAGSIHVSTAAQDFIWASRDVRSLNWNGREIRNAMQTSLALAENEAQENGSDKIIISEKHLRAVVQMSKAFKEYMDDDKFADEDDEDHVQF